MRSNCRLELMAILASTPKLTGSGRLPPRQALVESGGTFGLRWHGFGSSIGMDRHRILGVVQRVNGWVSEACEWL